MENLKRGNGARFLPGQREFRSLGSAGVSAALLVPATMVLPRFRANTGRVHLFNISPAHNSQHAVRPGHYLQINKSTDTHARASKNA